MRNKGTIFILTAGILWGFMGVFVNTVKSFGFTALECSALRVISASFIFLIYTALTDRHKLKISLKDIPLLSATGFIGISGMSMLYIMSIDKTSLSTAAVLLYVSPVWVMLMSFLFLKDRMTVKKIVAVLMAFLGCFIISGGIKTSINTGIILGILSGIAYASYSIFCAFALKKYSVITVTTYAFLFGAILMLFVGAIPSIMQKFSVQQEFLKVAGAVLLMGLVTAVLPFMFYTKGLEKVPASKAAVIVCVEPLTASVLGWVLYNENLNYIGIALIISAILVLQINKKDL